MSDSFTKLLVTTAESVISLSKDGTVVDQALLDLCNQMIERMNLMARVMTVQSERIDMLQQRHDALLQAFYMHCQDVARLVTDPREIN